VVQGLLRYGFQREAGELAFRLCQAVYKVFEREQRIYEFYDPDDLHTAALRRKRGNFWKALTLGRGPQREFVGWTGLVNNLVLEVLLGLDPHPPARTICPRLPPACIRMTLDLDLPSLGLKLRLRMLDADHFEGSVTQHGKVADFQTRFAKPVHLDSLFEGA